MDEVANQYMNDFYISGRWGPAAVGWRRAAAGGRGSAAGDGDGGRRRERWARAEDGLWRRAVSGGVGAARRFFFSGL